MQKVCRFAWIFYWILHSVLDGAGLQITDLTVPRSVQNGSDYVILDCQYALLPDDLKPESGLVVKWFFNSSPSPIYQWIPGKKPQDLGLLKGRLDLDYRVSDHNVSMHRALFIKEPTTDLSGDYKCLVSTFWREDFMTKKMVVFAPEKRMVFFQSKPDLDSVNITCIAQGIYPEPKMALYKDPDRKTKLFCRIMHFDDRLEARFSFCLSTLGELGTQPPVGRGIKSSLSGHKSSDICEIGIILVLIMFHTPDPQSQLEIGNSVVEKFSKNGVYDIKASAVIEDQNLVTPVIFECELSIPDAKYYSKKSSVFYPGIMGLVSDSDSGESQAISHSYMCIVLTFMLILFCEYFDDIFCKIKNLVHIVKKIFRVISENNAGVIKYKENHKMALSHFTMFI